MARTPVELNIDPSLHHRAQSYDNRTPDGRMSLEEDTKAQDRKSSMTTRQSAERTSMSSDEDEDNDDLLPPSSNGQNALAISKGGFYGPAASASTASLGFDSQQNVFATSKEEIESDGIEMQDVGAGNGRPKGSAPSSERRKMTRKERERQRTIQFAKEMAFVTIPSILLSMLGSVLAGEVLAKLKTWPVFLRVEELYILVPILLNLKGNLEMNLAARFSTSANIGELDLRQTRRSLILGNMALLQVQALLASLLAGIVAFVLGLMSRTGVTEHGPAALAGHDISVYGVERGGYFECAMVLCSSMLAASVSSAVVGAFMCSLVVVSRYMKINPDNLATPLAGSLGDLLALVILAIVANAGAAIIGSLWSTVVLVILLGFIAMNIFFTMRNAYVQELIWAGWGPLLIALAISSATGLVLQNYVNEYRGFGLIAPVVTGVAGNVGAIFVSRISTALHGSKEEKYWLTATSLTGISTPILIAFLAFVYVSGQAKFVAVFALSYTVLSFVVMVITMFVCYYLTFWLWKRDYDPDINALPLMSSVVDLFGQILLVFAYMFAAALGGDVKLPTPIITADGTVLTNVTSIATDAAVDNLKWVFVR